MLRHPPKKPPAQALTVDNQLQPHGDNPAAASLFTRILRAVREQTAENRQKREREQGTQGGAA